MSQISTKRTYEVAGSFSITLIKYNINKREFCRKSFFINFSVFFHLINSVVVTNKMDKLTVTAASKQKDLKWAVAQDINNRRKEGRQVVRSSLVSRRLNTISIFNPFDGVPTGNILNVSNGQNLRSYYDSLIFISYKRISSACVFLVQPPISKGLNWLKIYFCLRSRPVSRS